MPSVKLPSSQRAVVIKKVGDPSVLEFIKSYEVPQIESIQPNQILIKNVFAGINYIDTNVRKGQIPSNLPLIAGMEGSGIIISAGLEAIKLFPIGLKVGYMGMEVKSYSEFTLIDADQAVPVTNEKISFEDICGAMMQGMTTHYLTSSDGSYEVKKNDHVLIHAGAGGMGSLLTMIAKAKGAHVTTTVSTEEKAKRSKSLGADTVLLYSNQDGSSTDEWVEKARKVTGKQEGFNVIYDSVGKATFHHSMNLVAKCGTVVLFGSASGPPDPIPPLSLVSHSTKLTRPTLFHYIQTPETLRRRANDALSWIEKGQIKFDYVKYPLEDAVKAHEALEGRKTSGKLLLQI